MAGSSPAKTKLAGEFLFLVAARFSPDNPAVRGRSGHSYQRRRSLRARTRPACIFRTVTGGRGFASAPTHPRYQRWVRLPSTAMPETDTAKIIGHRLLHNDAATHK